MKGKQCGREIPEAAIFCCWCGVKQLRERRKKDAIKVPKPRKLRSGAWNIELRAEGQSITEATAELCEAKTLKNVWGLFPSALKSAGVEPGEVTLAQVASKDLPWLDYEQIKTFLEAVKYEPCELGALLALHSLRRSEIYALTAADVDLAKGLIRVEGAAVLDADNNLTQKDTNKNETSRRTVPIMIPRLREMLPGAMAATDGGALVQGSLNTLYVQINRVCDAAGLPRVGVHGYHDGGTNIHRHGHTFCDRHGNNAHAPSARRVLRCCSRHSSARRHNCLALPMFIFCTVFAFSSKDFPC